MAGFFNKYSLFKRRKIEIDCHKNLRYTFSEQKKEQKSMSVLTVYYSFGGNTRRITQKIHAELGGDIADYDTIIIGTPVWWYTFAPAMKTFLESNDWHGKRIFPFATNGGWLGHTPQDFEHACRGAKVANTLNIRFDGSRQMTPRSFVDKWIEAIKQETGGAK